MAERKLIGYDVINPFRGTAGRGGVYPTYRSKAEAFRRQAELRRQGFRAFVVAVYRQDGNGWYGQSEALPRKSRKGIDY